MKISGIMHRKSAIYAVLAAGTVFGGFLNSCNNRLTNFAFTVDPCGTFLANCNPGDFQARNTAIGDPCIDPTCTIPGQCGGAGDDPVEPLGTQFRLCD
ncbi:MAG: hypothetical protein ACYTHJ_11975 [Planctomycetota bacterium]|jgi:hypothetical protein